jgi:hypothetical protein
MPQDVWYCTLNWLFFSEFSGTLSNNQNATNATR